jgi:PAS domain S-box-containing protein
MEVRAAEGRFEGAFEGAMVGLALASPDGTLLRANRALCELFGRSGEQLAGRPVAQLLEPHGEDAAACARCSPARRSA